MFTKQTICFMCMDDICMFFQALQGRNKTMHYKNNKAIYKLQNTIVSYYYSCSYFKRCSLVAPYLNKKLKNNFLVTYWA